MKGIAKAGQRLGLIVVSFAALAAGLTALPAQASDAAADAAATSTQARWDAIVARHQAQRSGIAPKVATPPVINSVSITTPNITVSPQPTAARMSFNITSQAGLNTVMVDVRSRDYLQGYRREIFMPFPYKSGSFYFETEALFNANKPGAWDIRFIGVCDVLGQCTEQNFYNLEPVAARTFNVTNPRTPDVTRPAVTSALLQTPSIVTHSTGTQYVNLRLGVSDTLGVAGISVCARPPAEAYEVCGWWELPASATTGYQFVTIPFVGNTHEAATWHIAVVELIDRAGNNLFINDPTDLDAMFPGGRTFTVTNGS